MLKTTVAATQHINMCTWFWTVHNCTAATFTISAEGLFYSDMIQLWMGLKKQQHLINWFQTELTVHVTYSIKYKIHTIYHYFIIRIIKFQHRFYIYITCKFKFLRIIMCFYFVWPQFTWTHHLAEVPGHSAAPASLSGCGLWPTVHKTILG